MPTVPRLPMSPTPTAADWQIRVAYDHLIDQSKAWENVIVPRFRALIAKLGTTPDSGRLELPKWKSRSDLYAPQPPPPPMPTLDFDALRDMMDLRPTVPELNRPWEGLGPPPGPSLDEELAELRRFFERQKRVEQPVSPPPPTLGGEIRPYRPPDPGDLLRVFLVGNHKEWERMKNWAEAGLRASVAISVTLKSIAEMYEDVMGKYRKALEATDGLTRPPELR